MPDKLIAALRRRFKTPHDAVKALGLDAAILEEGNNMPSPVKLTPTALYTKGALVAYLRPRLAMDARPKFDYNALVSGLTAQNFTARAPMVHRAVMAATRGKLAQDADLQDLGNLIDALKGSVVPEAAGPGEPVEVIDAEPNGGPPPTPENDTPEVDPDDMVAMIKQYLEEAGVGPEIINNLDAFLAAAPSGNGDNAGAPPPVPPAARDELPAAPPATAATDEDPADLINNPDDKEVNVAARSTPATHGEGENVTSKPDGAHDEDDEDTAHDEDDDEDKRAEDEMTPTEQKSAMDKGLVTRAAMDKAIKLAQDKAIRNQRAIRDAERFVRPWVGELAMDAATPADVYRATLKALGVKDADRMHRDALRPVLEAQPKPSARVAQDRRHVALAQDAKAVGSFADRFPEAGKITIQ